MTNINSVSEFLRIVFTLSGANGIRCYRGEANSTWELKPSVMRNLKPNAETNIISELLLEAPSEFYTDSSMFHKLVRAQHYGLPTRLLDVSLNPLVALFYSCEDKTQKNKDGAVIILDFEENRVKFADSDTVSILSNLAKLSDLERENLVKRRDEIALERNRRIWTEQKKERFRKEPEIERLIQFVRAEKPYFLNKLEPTDLARYYFVHPAKNNNRVISQSGAFVLAGLTQFENAKNSNSFTIRKYIVPSSKKNIILSQLDKININSRTMYPDIENNAKYIKEKWNKNQIIRKNRAKE